MRTMLCRTVTFLNGDQPVSLVCWHNGEMNACLTTTTLRIIDKKFYVKMLLYYYYKP